MTKARNIAEFADDLSVSNGEVSIADLKPSQSMMFRNRIINGNFDIWQRNTSVNGITNATYPAADRWKFWTSVSSVNVARTTFSVNQTEVPNSSYYQTITIPANSAAGDYVTFNQHIEDVNQFYSKSVTLSFYAKADSNWTIGIEPIQNFGTGGSSRQLGTAQTVNVTTSWARHSVTFNLNNINGITLGTGHNFEVAFWLTAGSNNNSRTGSIPNNKSGTFDIAQVQLEEGTVATPFEHRPYGVELILAKRYFENLGLTYAGHWGGTKGLNASTTIYYDVVKRATPDVDDATSRNAQNGNTATVTASHITTRKFVYSLSATTGNTGDGIHFYATNGIHVNAEI